MIQKPKAHSMEIVKEIKLLYKQKSKNGKRKYSQKRLGKMYFVDQKTICNYLKLNVG